MRKFILWLCLSVVIGVGLVMSPMLTSGELGTQGRDGEIVLAKKAKKKATKKKAKRKRAPKKKAKKKRAPKKKAKKKK